MKVDIELLKKLQDEIGFSCYVFAFTDHHGIGLRAEIGNTIDKNFCCYQEVFTIDQMINCEVEVLQDQFATKARSYFIKNSKKA